MFSKFVKNSHGYTLFLTILIIFLFSIVGLSLVRITINGTMKNNIREDSIQSLNLAEKGGDFLINEINTSLSTFTKDGKSRDDFIDELEKYDKNNARYKCTFDKNGNLISGLSVSTNNSSDQSIACIKNVNPVYEEDGSLNDLKRNLEIVSFGLVDGNRKQLTTFVEIGSDLVPEQLKYALTSDGNIHLNGAVQITGDLRLNGSLTTFDYSHIVNGNHYWVESLKPSIRSISKRTNPRIVVGGNSKFYHVKDNISNAETLYKQISELNTKSNSLIEVQKKDVKELFDTSVFDKIPTVIVSQSEIKDVKIEDLKSTYKYNRSTASDLYSNFNMLIPQDTYNGKKYLVKGCSNGGFSSQQCVNETPDDPFILQGTYVFDQLATSGDLKIKGDSSTNPTKVTIKDKLYVGGDLIIQGNVELNGSIFVNGHLKIGKTNKIENPNQETSTNLLANTLIYVNNPNDWTEQIHYYGNLYTYKYEPVDIEYAKINSLPYINDQGEKANGTLVIFSRGKVKLSNNSSWQDDPSEIYGYFYSDEGIEIYGSGSNMKIHGGISGNQIILHAIRGKAKDYNFSNSKKYNDWYFLNRSQQKLTESTNPNELSCNFPDKSGKKTCYKYDSRLQVHYNEDVIGTYIELNRTEQLIYTLSPPKIVDQKL